MMIRPVLVCLGISLLPVLSSAQALPIDAASVSTLPNILVNDPAQDHSRSDTQSETTLVLGADSAIVVVFNDSGSQTVSPNQLTGWARSANWGDSFQDMGTLPSEPVGDVGDPALARDTQTGTIYLTTLTPDAAQVLLLRSFDNGRSFADFVNCAPGFGLRDSLDKPWLAVDNFPGLGRGNVYSVYANQPSVTTGAQQKGIYCSVSKDGGSTWTNRLIWAGGAGPFVSVAPDHTVYAFWGNLTLSNQVPIPSIAMRKSTDFAAHFAAIKTVTFVNRALTNLDLNMEFRADTYPRAAVHSQSGGVYLVYADAPGNGDRGDIFFQQSHDKGDHWTSRVRLNDDATLNDQWAPVIAITPDGNYLFAAWYDRRLNSATGKLIDTFGTIGAVSGTNVFWSPNFRITTTSFPPVINQDRRLDANYMGDYDQAVADNENFYYTWSDNRNSDAFFKNQPDVRFTKIPVPGRFSGFTASNGRFDAALSTAPGWQYSIEASPDLIHWQGITNFQATSFASRAADTGKSERNFYRARLLIANTPSE